MSFPAAIDPRRARMPRVSLPRPRALAMRRKPSRLTVLATIVLIATLIVGGWALLRNSSLVQVQEVKVVGLGGYYDRNARRAVETEAKTMTTMNYDEQALSSAAAAFVDVAGVEVTTDFPHGMTIRFDVRRPVVLAKINGRTVALAADGTIVTNARNTSALPKIDVSGSIAGSRVTDGKALGAATVLGAAPDLLLRKVDAVKWGKLGLILTLDKGVQLYFGNSQDARQKWRDAAAVLASPETRGATYVDLRAPGRPSVGGLGAAPQTVSPSTLDELPEEPAASGAAAQTGTDEATQQNPAAAPRTNTQTQTTPQQQTTQQPATTQGPAGGASPNP